MGLQIDFANATPNIDITPGSPGVRIDVSARGPVGPRGEQGPGVGETVASISSERGWRALRAALATGTARVAAMGDSKTEGTGLNAVSERWLNLLQDALRGRYAPTGDQGLGYLPADYFTFYGFPTETTRSATGWQSVGNGGGLGNRSIHMTSGGWVQWPAMTFTAGVPLVVHWTRIPSGASMEVLVDGAVVSTIVTGGADRSMSTTVAVAAGSHVIRVRHKAGSGDAVRIEGVVHRTKATGVIVVDAARSGAKVSDYSDGMVADGAPTSDDRHWEAVGLVAPHAIVMAFGANDMASHSAQEWGEDLAIAVAKAKACAPGVGVVLLVGAQGTGDVNTDPGKILAFEAAARAAVGSDPDVSILYESQLWAPTAGVDYTAGDPSGWLAPGDTVHTSAAAHAQIARYLLGSVTGVDAATDAASLAQAAAAAAVASMDSIQRDASSGRLYFSAAPTPPVMADNFDRPDESPVSPTPIGGRPLLPGPSTTLSVVGNQLAMHSTGGATRTGFWDAGQADGVYRITVADTGWGGTNHAFGVLFRASGPDWSSGLVLRGTAPTGSNYGIQTRSGGAYGSYLSGVAAHPASNGDQIEVAMSGASITVRVNGNVIYDATPPGSWTGTHVGVFNLSGRDAVRFDDMTFLQIGA